MPTKPTVLQDRYRNRGTAFTLDERAELGIVGRLPAAVETLDEQARRAYDQLRRQPSDLHKYAYLNAIHDRNQVLYFRLLGDHLAELLPVVYDPTVGDAIEQWSSDYRDSRAVYLSIDRPDDVRASFASLGLGPGDVDLIVVSDAQEILGIGDWGVNGTDISIGKLAVYTAAAGIDPNRVLAVNLDVGTDNEQLLNSPRYLGNRHARITGKRYDEFVARYQNEPGSSIMPGKVNPTQCEAIVMIAIQVLGNDTAVAFAGSQGNFELNAMRPIVINNFLNSARILADGMQKFREFSVTGTELNRDKIDQYVTESLVLVTALAPTIGYQNAAHIAETALAEGQTLKQAAVDSGHVDEETFDDLVDPKAMTGSGVAGA